MAHAQHRAALQAMLQSARGGWQQLNSLSAPASTSGRLFSHLDGGTATVVGTLLSMGRRLSGVASSAAGAAATAAARPARSTLLQDYKQLSKLKLSLLVTATASAGYIAGSGEAVNWSGFLWTSLGTLSASACANSLNQLYEVANDARMSRTMNRPLPTGRLSRVHAAAFALVTGIAGVGILSWQTNTMTASLGAANIGLYAAVYTPLKQLTVANTWVGALVGAIPPLMGWAAASDGALEPGAWLLAAALFSWQMPHFFALSWLCKDDYIRGGFRMLSAVDAAGRRTGLAALRHSLYLLPIGAALVAAGTVTEPLAWEAAALAAALVACSARFLAAPTSPNARVLFRASLLYLPAVMVGIIVHRLPNQHNVTWADLQAQLAAGLPEEAAPALAAACASLRELLPSAKVQCPSKAYSDSGEQDEVPAQQQQQQQGAAAVESSSGGAAAAAPTLVGGAAGASAGQGGSK